MTRPRKKEDEEKERGKSGNPFYTRTIEQFELKESRPCRRDYSVFEINRIDFAKYNPDKIVPLNKILNIAFTIGLSLFSSFLRIAFTMVLTTCIRTFL